MSDANHKSYPIRAIAFHAQPAVALLIGTDGFSGRKALIKSIEIQL